MFGRFPPVSCGERYSLTYRTPRIIFAAFYSGKHHSAYSTACHPHILFHASQESGEHDILNCTKDGLRMCDEESCDALKGRTRVSSCGSSSPSSSPTSSPTSYGSGTVNNNLVGVVGFGRRLFGDDNLQPSPQPLSVSLQPCNGSLLNGSLLNDWSLATLNGSLPCLPGPIVNASQCER